VFDVLLWGAVDRCGLRDWYRWRRRGTRCFSGGEGVGVREEMCVTVGDTAIDCQSDPENVLR